MHHIETRITSGVFKTFLFATKPFRVFSKYIITVTGFLQIVRAIVVLCCDYTAGGGDGGVVVVLRVCRLVRVFV